MARGRSVAKSARRQKSGGQSFYKYLRGLAESGRARRCAACIGHVAVQQIKHQKFFVMPIKCLLNGY
jgi:hypothetical protein